MKVRFLKKKRHFRAISLVAIMGLMIVSFQNCAPQPNCGSVGSACTSDSASTSPTSGTSGSGSTRSSNQNSPNLVIGGGSSSSSGSSSSANNGAIQVGSGMSSGISASGGSTSTGYGSGSGSSSSGSGFRIVTQPSSQTVYEGQNFTIQLGVTGGSYPYTYQWYKDGAAITSGLGNYSMYADVADRWTKEGTYYVVIKDSSGATLTSASARIGIAEQAIGCNAGSYFTYTSATYDTAYQYFSLYFDGPRGKYLLNQSYDFANILYAYASYAGLKSWSIGALPYLGHVAISCTQTIPRIHTASNNTCTSYVAGAVNFECHNGKLKFISDTCQLADNGNCYSGGGGGGN